MGRLQPTTDNCWQHKIKPEKSRGCDSNRIRVLESPAPLSTPAASQAAKERAPLETRGQGDKGEIDGLRDRKTSVYLIAISLKKLFMQEVYSLVKNGSEEQVVMRCPTSEKPFFSTERITVSHGEFKL